MKEEEKTVFIELDKVQKSWDRKKEEELLIEIRKLEETKRKELEAAVKSGDTKKAVELRKYLRIFSEVGR